MKLGEAKRRLSHIERRLIEYTSIFSKGPLKDIGTSLNGCNTLLQEKQILEKAIIDTEAVTELGGIAVENAQTAYRAIQRKIEYINILINRDDLKGSLKEGLFEQLAVLKDSRDNLEKGIEVCLWETELLE